MASKAAQAREKDSERTKGTERALTALLSQEEAAGRRDSLLEKAMQHQDTTQGKRKCPKPVPALQSLRRMTLVRGMEIPGKGWKSQADG